MLEIACYWCVCQQIGAFHGLVLRNSSNRDNFHACGNLSWGSWLAFRALKCHFSMQLIHCQSFVLLIVIAKSFMLFSFFRRLRAGRKSHPITAHICIWEVVAWMSYYNLSRKALICTPSCNDAILSTGKESASGSGGDVGTTFNPLWVSVLRRSRLIHYLWKTVKWAIALFR